jgi:hypothetical protein
MDIVFFDNTNCFYISPVGENERGIYIINSDHFVTKNLKDFKTTSPPFGGFRGSSTLKVINKNIKKWGKVEQSG